MAIVGQMNDIAQAVFFHLTRGRHGNARIITGRLCPGIMFNPVSTAFQFAFTMLPTGWPVFGPFESYVCLGKNGCRSV